MAVGDDDQNIYTWNGADVRFLQQFTRDYDAATHHLLTNFRSSPEIVARTSAFISGNTRRMKRDSAMKSSREDRLPDSLGQVSFLAAASADEALSLIIAEIRRIVGRGFMPQDIAVLSRFNEDILKLRFLADEAGFPAAILRKPPLSVLRLREIKRFLDRLKQAGRPEPPLEKVAELVQSFREGFSSPDNPWEILIDAVIEQYFEETSHPSMSDCFHFFMDSVREFRQGEARRAGSLSLATMHAAKGLEFPHVYLVGVEEEILPHRECLEGARLEEERRLMYVGITRAQRSLVISYCARRKRGGEITACDPSRFLDEIDPNEIKRSGAGAMSDTAEVKEDGRRRLSALKAMLSK